MFFFRFALDLLPAIALYIFETVYWFLLFACWKSHTRNVPFRIFTRLLLIRNWVICMCAEIIYSVRREEKFQENKSSEIENIYCILWNIVYWQRTHTKHLHLLVLRFLVFPSCTQTQTRSHTHTHRTWIHFNCWIPSELKNNCMANFQTIIDSLTFNSRNTFSLYEASARFTMNSGNIKLSTKCP